MESVWRVACVRIPRFPIGAVWRQRAAVQACVTAQEVRRVEQLSLLPELPTTPTARAMPRHRGNGSTPRDATRHDRPSDLANGTSNGTPNGARPSGTRARTDANGDTPDASGAFGAPSDFHAGATGDADATDDIDEPHWDARPLALVDGMRLRAVTAAAARQRVRAGMTVSQARHHCASLELLSWDEPTVAREIVRTTAALLVASPQVTPVAGAPGMWWIGAGGLDGVGGERALVRTLLRVARLWHPQARVAVADSCVAARAATWADHGGTAAFMVPRGGCASYLAPAPLTLVPMEDELRQTLHALGLRSAGAFAALALQDVERRWGASGVQAWRLAHGHDPRRPVLARPDTERAVSAELATPATSMEPVLFLVRAALDRLVRTLVADGRAAAAVAITLTLDDGRGALPAGGLAHTVTRELRPARPLARVAPLFERCRGLLADWPLQAPICGVTVRIAATTSTSAEQGDLLVSAWRDPAAAEAALERLRSELGPNVVVRPIRRDAHLPERAGAWVDVEDREVAADTGRRDARTTRGARASRAPRVAHPHRVAEPSRDTPTADPSASAGLPSIGPSAAAASATSATSTPSSPAEPPPDLPSVALRLLETPEPVTLEWRDDAPRAVWWRGRCVPVQHADGPECLAGDWWSEPYRRDYWRCTAADGEFLIYRDDREDARWFLQGWYD